jgi:hypothetical protein
MAKYFIHNNEETTHDLVNNLPSGYTAVEIYSSEFDAMLTAVNKTVVSGCPSVLVELNCYVGLLNDDRALQWINVHADIGNTWAEIEQSLVDWVANDDRVRADILAIKPIPSEPE